MTHWRYRFSGLLFDSALHLPEWSAFGSGDVERDPDVRIAFEGCIPQPPRLDEPPVIQADEYRFSVPGVGSYSVCSGRTMTVAAAPGVSGGEVRLFLLGTALAALLYQRGLLALHASVVRLGDRAVALCGPVRSGKSTLAAALVRGGASFVCDDLARFDIESGPAVVYPSAPRFKLAPEAIEALAWTPQDLAPVHARASKLHALQDHHDPWSPIRLHAIYLLEWADGPERTTHLTGARALRELVEAGTYRPALLEPMGQLAAHWQRCARVAAGTRVQRLTRPRTWPALARVVELIVGGVRDEPDATSALYSSVL